MGMYSSYAAPVPKPAKEPLPRDLENEMETIEQWAQSNRKEAALDKGLYYGLKIAAALLSGSSGSLAKLGSGPIAIAAGLLGSGSVAVDGIVKPGRVYKVKEMAYLRLTQPRAEDNECLAYKIPHKDPEKVAREIIAMAGPERERINEDLRKAVAQLRQRKPRT